VLLLLLMLLMLLILLSQAAAAPSSGAKEPVNDALLSRAGRDVVHWQTPRAVLVL
jgi:hypothetical protein